MPQAGSATVSSGRRLDAVDHGGDQSPGGEVLPRAGLDVLGALGEQLLVGVALDVGARGGPVLLVDQVDDQPLELGRVLDLVLRLAEDHAQRARPAGRAPPGCAGSASSRSSPSASSSCCQRVSSPGTICLRVERPVRPLVRHLQEQQVGQLLRVLDCGDAVVAQHVAVVPQLRYQLARIDGTHSSVSSWVAYFPAPRPLRAFGCTARSARIRSSSTEAGSTAGSCRTSLPVNASARSERRSAAALVKELSRVWRSQSTSASRLLTPETILSCSPPEAPGTRPP